MRVLLPVLAALSVAVPAAHAGTITYGSDLKADATFSQAHQADAAFWPTTILGQEPGAPDMGQIVAIRLKGTVLQERGAHTPLNEVHFQHLIRHADGSVTESQTTQPFYVPYTGDPNQITTYKPVNLCVKKGDIIDFNDEGGWAYNGPGGSLDYDHYKNGAAFQIFGAARTSATAWFSGDSKTFAGMSWAPAGLLQGQELLMQLVLATGPDVGQACNWFNGVKPPPQAYTPKPRVLKIRDQSNHVSSHRAVGPMVYCPGGDACTGTGVLTYKGKVIGRGRLNGPGHKTLRIPMTLTPAGYKQLRRAPGRLLTVTFTVTSPLGTYTHAIGLRG